VSAKGLSELKDSVIDRELFALSNRFELFEELRKDGVLNTTYIALEAFGAIAGGLVSGRTDEQLRQAWPKEWGEDTATVPRALLLALASAWNDYREAPTGKTLGEVFKIEGGSAGKHPMRSKLATIDQARRLANEVEIEYLASNAEGAPRRLDEAIEQVAEANELSFQTVAEAHQNHRINVRKNLAELGVLKGVETSKG
jgi:hypothetical protein